MKRRPGRGKKKNSRRSHGIITKPIQARVAVNNISWMQVVGQNIIHVNKF